MANYYTPDITEYKYDLDFEMAIVKHSEIDWRQFNVAKHEVSIYMFKNFVKDGRIRVKYIDQEDIEECGWMKHTSKYLHGECEEYVYQIQDTKWYMSVFETFKYIHNGGDMEDNECFFQGEIKNKSELLTIMKMIGVRDE